MGMGAYTTLIRKKSKAVVIYVHFETVVYEITKYKCFVTLRHCDC